MDHVADADRHFGRGSWQHKAHAALAAGRCPRCRVELDAVRECPRCRLTWTYQHQERDGSPRPGTMVIRLRVARQGGPPSG